MRKEMKRLARVANVIHDQYSALRRQHATKVRSEIQFLIGSLERLGALRHSMYLCENMKLWATGNKLALRGQRMLREFQHELSGITQRMQINAPVIPSLGDVVDELSQLEEEFGEWRYEATGRRLVVSTDAIELEGIYLGPFEVWLELDRIPEQTWPHAYYVVALDPRPAASNQEVTHPHVSGERLCMGDAAVPIRSALENGRICDFFMLVRSVLVNYNPHSPYVALSEWDGTSCYECGALVDDESRYMCERCERDFCGECTSYCRRCDCTICSGCMTECEFCNDWYCQACIGECDGCGHVICEGCQEDRLCPDCRAAQEEEDEQGTEDEEREEVVADSGAQEAVAGAEVQADGVGQAPVLLPSRQD